MYPLNPLNTLPMKLKQLKWSTRCWYNFELVVCDAPLPPPPPHLPPFPQMPLIFGKNSRDNVAVVDVSIKAVMVTKANVTRSAIKLASTTTMALVMTTLYTDTPMYCESFSAGILTWRVSQAMYTPTINKSPLYAYKAPSQLCVWWDRQTSTYTYKCKIQHLKLNKYNISF